MTDVASTEPHDPATVAHLIEAGLYDPAAEGSAAQLELLTHLLANGATIDDMVASAATGQLIETVSDLRIFNPGRSLTSAEVAERCGVPVERVERIRLALGFPVTAGASLPSWAQEDVAGFLLASELFGEPPVLAFSRVMGSSAARLGEAALALFLAEVGSQLDLEHASPTRQARANEDATELVEVITVIMGHLVREHLHLAIQRQRAAIAPKDRTVLALAIGFVDLAGSTEWATAISIHEQADALARFEKAAWDIATTRGGRIVKLIGDEAMFVGNDAEAACEIALELCAAVEADPGLPPARGAVGFGEVAIRDGDYYGPLVHIVARAVKAADEGSIVVTESIPGQLSDRLTTKSLGLQPLRGIEEPVELFSVERVG